MTQNIYIVRDKVSNTTLSMSIAPTDGAFMRDVLPSVLQLRKMDEIEYCQIGTYDTESFTLSVVPSRICPMDAYKFPETDTKSLSEDDILRLAQQITSLRSSGAEKVNK